MLAISTLIMTFSLLLPTSIVGLLVIPLAFGAGSYILSTLASYVDQEHRTRMVSLFGIMQIVGSMYAYPCAGLFTIGMKLGDLWIGLPYMGVAALCGTVVGLLAFVQLSSQHNHVSVKGRRLGGIGNIVYHRCVFAFEVSSSHHCTSHDNNRSMSSGCCQFCIGLSPEHTHILSSGKPSGS